jgi:internalin A
VTNEDAVVARIKSAIERQDVSLVIAGADIITLPEELRAMTNLRSLTLNGLALQKLPEWIGDFPELEELDLSGNYLSSLPASIGKLSSLRKLVLTSNMLSGLPDSIGDLACLESLQLNVNRIESLPNALGRLDTLAYINIQSNPLADPPPEVVANGSDAIVDYLRGRLDPTSAPLWSSKVIVVGEAAVGKTSLTKALAGESVLPNEPQTHGVRTIHLELPHPNRADVRLDLPTWDFGGQQIYHATHRFFLTDRSLFVLVWNCREGYSKGQMRKWLQAITARAPESPILLVATHGDEHPADLPMNQLVSEFPRIVDSLYVDSLTGRGVPELADRIAETAAELPLMGQLWPSSWSRVRESIGRYHKPYASMDTVRKILAGCGVARAREQANVLGVLHSLGELLWFPDDPELRDLVVLAPKWVEERITRMLDSHELLRTGGVAKRDLLGRLWLDDDLAIRNHLVMLMEQFDLAYRTDSDARDDVCLVVEKLPENAVRLPDSWDEMLAAGASEIRLVFDFSEFLFLQAGIPTWFIAREHRFTTGTHWRTGALLHSQQEDAWALLTANEATRKVELAVRGGYPITFFSELKAGFERILTQRYPGIPYRLLVPCPCGRPDGRTCPHMFEYHHLKTRLMPPHRKEYIECPESLEDVHVRGLIEGFEPATLDDIREKLEGVQKTVDGFQDRNLVIVDYLRHLTANRQTQESHCPAVFTVTPEARRRFRQKLMILRFYCEQPQAWHPIDDGHRGSLTFQYRSEWFTALASHLRVTVNILRYLIPLAEPVAGALTLAMSDQTKSEIQLMKEFVDHIPGSGPSELRNLPESSTPHRVVADGELRVLERVLETLDPSRYWGGLSKITTPEGLTIWVCPKHLETYNYPAAPHHS